MRSNNFRGIEVETKNRMESVKKMVKDIVELVNNSWNSSKFGSKKEISFKNSSTTKVTSMSNANSECQSSTSISRDIREIPHKEPR